MAGMSDTTNPGASTTAETTAEPISPISVGWRAWCKLLADLDKANGDLEVHEVESSRLVIQKRLLRLSPDHTAEPGDIKKARDGLFRGVQMLQQMLGWEEPRVGGKGSDKAGAASYTRGEQWRLVLTFGAFELLTKAVLGLKGRGGAKPEQLAQLLTRVVLPPFVPIEVPPPPSPKQDIRKYLDAPTPAKLLEFLCLDHGDAKLAGMWLYERKPITTWVESICLTKALRNSIAHGAMSPTKAKELKIGPAITRLVEDIATTAGAVLIRLSEEDAP